MIVNAAAIWCNDRVAIVPAHPDGHCSGCGHVVEVHVTWEPIRTAPKDLNAVLLYWPYWTAEPVIGARNYRAVDDEHGGYELLDSWHTERWLGDDAEDPGPTHWMPLPEVPK